MTRPVDVEAQIAGFVAKYSPSIQTQLREARAALRAMFPRGYEMVFDNYNALVFGFGPTDRSSASFVSIAAYPKWVTLFFLDGRDLADPHGLLAGDGKQVRSVRLTAASDLALPTVRALLEQAIGAHSAALAAAPPISTVVRMVAVKQRPRRPA